MQFKPGPRKNDMSLLKVRNLSITFQTEHGRTEAVRSVNLEIEAGQTYAVVGESGSGKSVTALALTRLLPTPPAIIESGKIWFQDQDVLGMRAKQLRSIRGGGISYIFQEPSTSLNPVFTIRNQIAETIKLHRKDVKAIDEEVVHWLNEVGIVDPEKRMHDYPYQLSGGMQQRAMIAMALAARPALLVADEPTTALDVTIQAQIINLLKDLKARLNMSILLITHNFGIISGLADRVAVMFRGQIVEEGPTDRVLQNPQHSYTKALIACIPRLGSHQKRLPTINYEEVEEKTMAGGQKS